MSSDDVVLKLVIPEEKKAMDIFRQLRWNNGVYCPKCKSFSTVSRGMQGKTRRYSCKECGSNFSDLTGSIFANKNLHIGEMFYILMNIDKKSIKCLSEELNHKWESVYRLVKEFHENLNEKTINPQLIDEVEIDEMNIPAGSEGLKKESTEKMP